MFIEHAVDRPYLDGIAILVDSHLLKSPAWILDEVRIVGQIKKFITDEEFILFRDIYRQDIVLLTVQGMQYLVGTDAAYFMFGRFSAEKYCYTNFHNIPHSITFKR